MAPVAAAPPETGPDIRYRTLSDIYDSSLTRHGRRPVTSKFAGYKEAKTKSNPPETGAAYPPAVAGNIRLGETADDTATIPQIR